MPSSVAEVRPSGSLDVVDDRSDVQPARSVRVEHRGGDQFDVHLRGHVLRVDQPVEDGGDDTGPSPTELLVASLAACVGHYARRYLSRHGLPTEGLGVRASYALEGRPNRVGLVEVSIDVPHGVPEDRRAALLAVATHCTVHNTLLLQPAITMELAD